MIKILFISTGLQTGGAERMLLKILQNMDRSKFSPVVVSLLDEGTIGAEIRKLDIPVYSLRINSFYGVFFVFPRLAYIIRSGGFDILQGWMYHGNLFAWISRYLALSSAKICFGIRHTLYDLKREKLNTRIVIGLNGILSRNISACLFNSHLSLISHERRGFKAKIMEIIPNGFDIESFFPKSDRMPLLRGILGIGDEPVIGLVGRFDPAKDHVNFLKAASLIHQKRPDVKFVLVGRDVNFENESLIRWVKSLNLENNVVALGERADIPALNRMFDVACLSSYMEAFPNVLGEAMASATPCVSTDVGDCRAIIDETGVVVPAEDPVALSCALLEIVNLSFEERVNLGLEARKRISIHFEVKSVVARYMEFYESICRE